ncbi:MAG: hypothetical protein ACX93T_04410, partial [Bacteroidota bacterium]
QGTRAKTYAKQREMVEAYSGKGYELPSGIEVATSTLAHYAQSGNRQERLFGVSPLTFTRCTRAQLVAGRRPIFVGSFGPAGLYVNHDDNYDDSHLSRSGVACCRKFY